MVLLSFVFLIFLVFSDFFPADSLFLPSFMFFLCPFFILPFFFLIQVFTTHVFIVSKRHLLALLLVACSHPLILIYIF